MFMNVLKCLDKTSSCR